jgi:putative membrane protein
VIAMVCWFAGLFYLPRLFVYHAQSTDTLSIERFKIMERKLYRGIMWPSMVFTIALGIAMIFYAPDYYLPQAWLHAKLALVTLLVIYHFFCGYYRQQFANDNNQKSHVFYRVFNELPVLLLVAIVILVVVKPF